MGQVIHRSTELVSNDRSLETRAAAGIILFMISSTVSFTSFMLTHSFGEVRLLGHCTDRPERPAWFAGSNRYTQVQSCAQNSASK
jgi:hypothetical protein